MLILFRVLEDMATLRLVLDTLYILFDGDWIVVPIGSVGTLLRITDDAVAL